ncbi:MAG TPA: hypothetical protein VLM85_31820 [Polyangiaceae bacterium]|nr:hypothetical protein [Polyangiaceae bacterium]
MKASFFCAAVVVLVAPALARAEDVLEKAAAFDPTLRFGDVGALTIEPLLQTRWTVVEAGAPEPQSATGFSVPRARLTLTTSLFDAVSFRLRVGAKSDGSARFEQAYVEGRWRRLRARAGQFSLHLNAGEEPLPQELSSTEYSTYANTFAGGQTQGLELVYIGPVRVKGVVGNGARTGFSELLSPIVADVALTGRVEVPITARERAFAPLVEPSFRRGQRVTARIGATAHFQTKGATGSNPANEVELASADVDVRGSGFSIVASASYLRLAPVGTTPNEQVGFMAFASFFVARRVELWGQFDVVWPIGTVTPMPASFASGQPGTTPLRTLTTGANFFVVPNTNRLKVQIDLQTIFDPQSTSILPSDVSRGVLATSGPQVASRLQIVVAL